MTPSIVAPAEAGAAEGSCRTVAFKPVEAPASAGATGLRQ